MDICKVCGHRIKDNSHRCIECGEIIGPNPYGSDDNGNVLYFLLGFLLPVLGFIIFLIWTSSKPKSAKQVLIGSMISFSIMIVIIFFQMILIPRFGIAEITGKSATYADALAFEQATDLYCADTLCDNLEEFTYGDIIHYLEGIGPERYEINNQTIVAQLVDGEVHVYLESSGTGEWEFARGEVPSLTTRDESVFRDND